MATWVKYGAVVHYALQEIVNLTVRLTNVQKSETIFAALLAPEVIGRKKRVEKLKTLVCTRRISPESFKLLPADDELHPPVLAYKKGKRCIVSDTLAEPWRKVFESKPHYRSIAAFPVSVEGWPGKVFAVIVLVSEQRHTFTNEWADKMEPVLSPYLRTFALLQALWVKEE